MAHPASHERTSSSDLSGVKVPPQAPDMERALLGALLSDGVAFSRVAHLVEPNSFYRPHHRTLYQCMSELDSRREPIDLITATEELRRAGKLEEIGGIPFISELAAEMPTSANVEHYARVVHEKSLLRKVISLSAQSATDASDPAARADEVFEKVQRALVELIGSRRAQQATTASGAMLDAVHFVETARNRGDHIQGYTSGFSNLDDVTTGFNRGELIIVAARPSMGKTALAMNFAVNAAAHDNIPVAVFSMEMETRQLVLRMLAGEAHIPLHRLRGGRMSREEYGRMSQAAGRLAELQIFFDDQAGLDIGNLRARARQLWLEFNIQMVIIDYLQLIMPPKMVDNQQQWIAYVSASLKSLAKELKIPVICLSQLSRATETRGGERKPILSDLRDSGAIEQDADIVMFVYRPEYYKDMLKGKKVEEAEYEIGDRKYKMDGFAEIIVAKNRNGPTRSVPLHFKKEYTVFAPYDVDTRARPPGTLGEDYGDNTLPAVDDNPF